MMMHVLVLKEIKKLTYANINLQDLCTIHYKRPLDFCVHVNPYETLAVLTYDMHLKLIAKEVGSQPSNRTHLRLREKSKGLYC
mgnify:CR=1 FL=1